jgi:prevent-host-death family protein
MHEPVNRLLASWPSVLNAERPTAGPWAFTEKPVAFASKVTTILVMSDTLPLAEVKAKFSEMVDRVEAQHDRITVTRNGRPAAVLMSPDDLASLEDTLDLLSNPQAVAELAVARTEAAAGKTVSADELRAKYLRG